MGRRGEISGCARGVDGLVAAVLSCRFLSICSLYILLRLPYIDVARGGMAPKFLACLVVLCFERRCFKENTVARLKSKYLALQKILGWLRYCFLMERCFYVWTQLTSHVL